MLETSITLKHNCGNVSVEENTLFRDYWGATPILISMKGFVDLNQTKETSFLEQIQTMQVPSNPYLVLPFLFVLGIIFTFTGDFFSYILPISIGSKTEGDKNLWLKAWTIHVISTYVFMLLAIKFLSDFLIKSAGYVIILIGGLMLLERYLERRHASQYLLATIPCAGSIFVATMIFSNDTFYRMMTPLVMNLGDLVLLKIGSKIPFPTKHVNKIPYVMFVLGGIVILKLTAVSGSPTGMAVFGGIGQTQDVVEANDVVTLSFSGKFEDKLTYGTLGWQTASFVVGSGKMISGVDNATRGMKKGETKEVFMTPPQGYGEYDPSLLMKVPLSSISDIGRLKIGKSIGLSYGNWSKDFVVLDISNNTVRLDGNHPLAGKILLFSIKIKDIKKGKTL